MLFNKLSSFVFNQEVFARPLSKQTNGQQQQADQYNTELFIQTHQRMQDMEYITAYNNANTNLFKISSTLTVAQSLHFGG